MKTKFKAWVAKDGDKVEEMSFFATKRMAQRFRKMGRYHDSIYPCEIIIKK